MNFLAHLFLGGSEPLEQLGNLAGDFVKGRSLERYHPEIQKGIQRHRAIDSHTDKHPQVLAAKRRFSPTRRRVAGILIDLSFDHFLSRHWDVFHATPLDQFIQDVHGALETHATLLPPRLEGLVPKIVGQQWLLSYGDFEALGRTIDRVATRLSRPQMLKGGIDEVKQHYPVLEQDFLAFFPELIDFNNGLSY